MPLSIYLGHSFSVGTANTAGKNGIEDNYQIVEQMGKCNLPSDYYDTKSEILHLPSVSLNILV